MYTFPLLEKARAYFERGAPVDLSKVYIAACQHILEPQQKMFSLLAAFGIPKENFFILGKAYSTSVEVLTELQVSGFKAEQPDFLPDVPFDMQHAENCGRLFESVKRVAARGSKIIIIDDGAALLSVFNERVSELVEVELYGVEQTSSGFRRLESVDIEYPVMNVARSIPKLNEENVHIALNAVEKMRPFFGKLRDKRALVIGLGPIGAAVKNVLQKEGFVTSGFDIAYGHADLMRQIDSFDPSLIVGATGWTVMTADDLRRLSGWQRSIFLVSVSSSDREFPVAGIRTSKGVHDEIDFGSVCIVNNGFPISFRGNRSEIEHERIEPTIAQLLGSALYWTVNGKGSHSKGLVEVPSEILRLIRQA